MNMLLRLGDTKDLVMLKLEGSTMSLCKELGFVVEGGQLDIASFATSRVKAVVHHDVPVLAVVARIDFTHRRIVLDAVRSVHPRGSIPLCVKGAVSAAVGAREVVLVTGVSERA